MGNRIVELAKQVVDFTNAAERFEELIEHHGSAASKARDNLDEALRQRNEAMARLASHVGSPPVVEEEKEEEAPTPAPRGPAPAWVNLERHYDPVPHIAVRKDFVEMWEPETAEGEKPKPKRKQHNRTHEKQRPSRIREGTQRTREFKYWSGQYVSRARAMKCGTVETYYNHKGDYRRAIWLTKSEKKKVMADCLKRYPSHKYNSKKEQNNG